MIGRIVDSDGNPLEGVTVLDKYAMYPDLRKQAGVDHPYGEFMSVDAERPTITDTQGRFEIKGIIPGLKYSAEAHGPTEGDGQPPARRLGTIFSDVIANSAATKDLGDLRAKPDEDEQETQSADENAKSSEKAPALPGGKGTG